MWILFFKVKICYISDFIFWKKVLCKFFENILYFLKQTQFWWLNCFCFYIKGPIYMEEYSHKYLKTKDITKNRCLCSNFEFYFQNSIKIIFLSKKILFFFAKDFFEILLQIRAVNQSLNNLRRKATKKKR